MSRLPRAQELLPHAEADARSSRNTIVGFIGAPFAILGFLGAGLMGAVGASGGSEGSELFVLLTIFGAVLLTGRRGLCGTAFPS